MGVDEAMSACLALLQVSHSPGLSWILMKEVWCWRQVGSQVLSTPTLTVQSSPSSVRGEEGREGGRGGRREVRKGRRDNTDETIGVDGGILMQYVSWPLTPRSASPGASLALSDCDDVQPSGAVGVKFYLTASDLRLLKLTRGLGTSPVDTYLAVAAGNGFVEQGTTNELREYTSANAFQVTQYHFDVTRPEVVENGFVNFDLNEGQFTVAFTEPMDAQSVTLPGTLVFQHHSDVVLSIDSFIVAALDVPADEDNVTFVFPRHELNRLKLNPRVCTSAATCWLTIMAPGSFISDMAMNPVDELPNGQRTSQRYLGNFTEDTTGPLLEGFTLNMTSQEVILTFDEPVDAETANVSGITIQAGRSVSGPSLVYRLTSGTVLSENGDVVQILLSDEDISGLQSRPAVATIQSNTYIALDAGVFQDLSYLKNPSQAIDSASAISADTYVPDMAPPTIEAFDLDLDSNSLTLSFSEPVLVSSLQLDRLVLHDSPSGAIQLRLTGGDVLSTELDAMAEVTFILTDADVTFLEDSVDIATDSSNTYLSSLAGLAEDTNGVISIAVPDSQALQVREFTLDDSAPRVIAFDLNLNLGELVVTFNDVIDASSFDEDAITLQSEPTREPQEWHTLSSDYSTHSMVNGFEVTVTLGSEDLNRVKQIRSLATGMGNTFLTAAATIADDVHGFDAIAVTDGNALQASSFTGDSVRPALDAWTLDMDSGQIVLTFSETVDILTLDHSEISVHSSSGGGRSYPLTGVAELTPSDADYLFAITLSEADANSIKADTDLGTSRANSYLTLTANAIFDMSSNAIIGIPSGSGLQAGEFIPDVTVSQLTSFSLDVNLGLLQLSFDETVLASTFNVSALTLVNRASRYTSGYVLESSTASTINSAVIDVTLSAADLNAIKAISNLATSISDTYIIATPYTVQDMNGNALEVITSDNALQVSNYTDDSTRPELMSFDLDLSLEQLVLTFSEAVRATSLDPTQITLQRLPSGSGRTVTLTGGAGSRDDAPSITLQLSEEDANVLKLYTNIATSEDNTFISLTSGTVQDPAGNSLVPVPSNNAQQVRGFVEDLVSPQLVSFTLDLNQQLLSLTFDETVDSGSFSIIDVSLQDRPSFPTQTVQLSARSTTASTDGTVFDIQISEDDFNEITAAFSLGTMETDTFIALPAGTVLDMNGNPSVEVSSDIALQISNFTADTTRPSLVDFELDLNVGILTLTFSESINVTSFDIRQVTLQSAPSSPVETYTLSGGLVSLAESTTIDVDLLQSDLNDIKANPDLASLGSNTYLSVTAATVQDANGNFVLPVTMSDALFVARFTADTSGPIIEAFDLSYDRGILTLSFDETVNVSTIQTSALTFQSAADTSLSVYTLQDSVGLDTGLLTFARVQLAALDLNELKRLRICTDISSCYLSATTSFIEDTSGNQNVQVDSRSALGVDIYSPDVTAPAVVRYTEFDLDSGTFTLEFSETVEVSTFNFTQVKLHSSYGNATSIFQFDELVPATSDNYLVTFQVGPDDQNRMKLDTGLCTYDGNCWLRFTSEFISDVQGIPVVPILPNTISAHHQPELFIPDTTPPHLLAYTIDLDSGVMTFTFNEVVREATFTPMNLIFQDAFTASSSVSLRELGSFSRSEDGLSLDWNMTIPDLNLLKSYELVFANLQSSYLTYDYLIDDISGVGIAPRLDGVDPLSPSYFVADTTRPQLESFLAFNFDNGSLTLQFDEPVNLSSLNIQEIAITNNFTFDLHIYDRIRINDWYSLYYENGSIYNLTHLFEPGDYLLSCDFPLECTKAPPTVPPTDLTIDLANFSGSGSGLASGSGDSQLQPNQTALDEQLAQMQASEEDCFPILLRGCTIYRNLSVTDPFLFLTGGEASYVDERKQQVLIEFNRDDQRYFKINDFLAENDSNTWVAFNATAVADMSQNPVIVTNLFNATKLEDGAFVYDVTQPEFEFFVLDLDSDTLSLYFNDVMDVQTVNPLTIQLLDAPGSNNTYSLQGPYDYPKPLSIDPRDDYEIPIPLSFDDMNAIKNNLELATSRFNTYLSFPAMVATDIYGQSPTIDYTAEIAVQAQEHIPDTTGAILLDFEVDLNNETLTLYFNEVVNPLTFVPSRVTILNLQNSSSLDSDVPEFQYHTLTGAEPSINYTGVSTLELFIDLDTNALKVLPYIANTVNDTFITLETGAVLDMNGNPSQAVGNESALKASEVTEDTSPPYLEYFDLNLNDNLLILKFSESVRPDTFNVSQLMLQDGPTINETTDTETFDQNSEVVYGEFNSLVTIRLTQQDEDRLKGTTRVVATSRETTYLSLNPTTAEDYSNFSVLDIDSDSAVQVNLYFEGE